MLGRTVRTLKNTTHGKASFSQATILEDLSGVTESPAASFGEPQYQISSMSNGVKVATDASKQQLATVGVFVNAGSRFETYSSSGSSVLLKHLAFQSTKKASGIRLYRSLEDAGASVNATASREQIVYTAQVPVENAYAATTALSEAVASPKFSPWEIRDTKPRVAAEIAAANPQSVVTEALHAAAFHDDATLGRSGYDCDLSALTETELEAYHTANYTASSVSLAGVGVDHELLKAAAAPLAGLGAGAGAGAATTPAKYVGGESRVKSFGVGETHVAVAFNAAAAGSKEAAAFTVLRNLVGGGAFSTPYSDAGLFGFYGASSPDAAGAMVDEMVGVLKSVAVAAPSTAAVAGASAVAKLEWLRAFETAAGRVHSIGFATSFGASLPNGSASEFDAVTPADVQAAAKKALAGIPSIASFGKLTTVPRHADLVAKLK